MKEIAQVGTNAPNHVERPPKGNIKINSDAIGIQKKTAEAGASAYFIIISIFLKNKNNGR